MRTPVSCGRGTLVSLELVIQWRVWSVCTGRPSATKAFAVSMTQHVPEKNRAYQHAGALRGIMIVSFFRCVRCFRLLRGYLF